MKRGRIFKMPDETHALHPTDPTHVGCKKSAHISDATYLQTIEDVKLTRNNLCIAYGTADDFFPDDENGAKAKKKTAAPRHDLPQFFRVTGPAFCVRTDAPCVRPGAPSLRTATPWLRTAALATDCTPWLRTDTPWVRNCAFCEKNFGEKPLKFS